MRKYYFILGLMALALMACDDENETSPVGPTTPVEPEGEETQVLVGLGLPDSLVTTEDGGSVEIGVWLNVQPKEPVVVSVLSDAPDEALVSPTSLTFDPDNYNVAQTITVTGVADNEEDGDQKYHVVWNVLNGGNGFANFGRSVELVNKDVPSQVIDPSAPGVVIKPEKVLMTFEDGKTDTFNISLNSAPKSDVTVNLTTSNDKECSLDKSSLTFTADNWNVEQTVTVTGLDDDVEDGNVLVTIAVATDSMDADYKQLKIDPVRVVNVDNDRPGGLKGLSFMVDYNGLETDEYGTRGYIVIQLENRPAFDVRIKLEASDPKEVYLETKELVITPENGDDMFEIIATGLDDNEKDGDKSYTVKFVSIESEDPYYNNIKSYNFGDDVYTDLIQGINRDNEGDESKNGLVVKLASKGEKKLLRDLKIDATVSEKGETALYSVNLKSKPKDGNKVFVSGLVTDPTEGWVDPQTVTFDSTNWDHPQIVKIHGLDDDEIDGDVVFGVRFVSYSDDLANNDLSSDTYILVNIDDDGTLEEDFEYSLKIRKDYDVLYTSEDGTTRSIYLSLNRQPASDVRVYLQASDMGEGRFSNLISGQNAWYDNNKPYIVFTPLNWNEEQELVIQGVDDDIVDDKQNYNFTFRVQSDDAHFDGIETETVECVNYDNDKEYAPVTEDVYLPNSDVIVVTGLNTNETNIVTDKGLTFYVKLGRKPEKGTVPVYVKSVGEVKSQFYFVNPENEANSASPVVFTPENWNVLQPVTVLPNKAKVKDGTKADISLFISQNTCKDHSFDGLSLDLIPVEYRTSVTTQETEVTTPVEIPGEPNEPGKPRLVFSPNICNSIGSVTSEGGSQKYGVHLLNQPKNNVLVKFSIPEEFKSQVKLKNNKSNLTFKPSNYDVEQYIEVVGIDDKSSVDELITLNYSMTSADASYNGEDPNACDLRINHTASLKVPQAPKTRKLRIMAANTTSGTDQLYEAPGMNMFYAMDPDIILVQEFAESAEDVVDKLKSYFHTDYHYYAGNGRIGNGIIVKGDLSIKDTFSMPSVVRTIRDREYNAAIIDLPGDKDLIAVSLHLYTKCNDEYAEMSSPSQRSEYPAVAEFIQSILDTGDYYVAVGGDFNSRSSELVDLNWSGLLATNVTYPRDQEGNWKTNSARRQHYDWLLVDPKLQSYSVPTQIGDVEYPNGYVLDSRVQDPISAIAPVQYSDSAATNMQHMPVIRDFVLEY